MMDSLFSGYWLMLSMVRKSLMPSPFGDIGLGGPVIPSLANAGVSSAPIAIGVVTLMPVPIAIGT